MRGGGDVVGVGTCSINRRGAEGAEFSRREKAAELNQRFDDAEDGRRELVLQC